MLLSGAVQPFLTASDYKSGKPIAFCASDKTVFLAASVDGMTGN
jgi:hypothetical protein